MVVVLIGMSMWFTWLSYIHDLCVRYLKLVVIQDVSVFLVGAFVSHLCRSIIVPNCSRYAEICCLLNFYRLYTLLELSCRLLMHSFALSDQKFAFLSAAEWLSLWILAEANLMATDSSNTAAVKFLGCGWVSDHQQIEKSDRLQLISAPLQLTEAQRSLLDTRSKTSRSCLTTLGLTLALGGVLNNWKCAAASLSLFNYFQFVYCQSRIFNLADDLERRYMKAEEAKQRESEANKMAFMQFVLHEVRVPLNSLVLGIDLLGTEAGLSDECMDTVIMMKQSASFMVSTLNDVLSWQKIEQGKMDMDFKPMCAQFLVRSVLATFRVALDQKEIQVSARIDSEVPDCVEADFHRLQHVLANLMSNAIKFSGPHTHIDIFVSVVKAENKRWLRFTVRDEGIGISEEDQKRIFSPFVQIRPVSLQAGKGTGLGLSICKGMVRAHGGHLGCRSRETAPAGMKAGSEFYFEVPLIEMDVQSCITADMRNQIDSGTKQLERIRYPVICYDKEVQVDSEYLSPASEVRVSPQKLNSTDKLDVSPRTIPVSPAFLELESNESRKRSSIAHNNQSSLMTRINALICDDVQSNRKLLERVISNQVLSCNSCCNGQEAISLVTERGLGFYDIIFMDNIMPIMSGQEATKNLRMLGFPNLIIGVTGSAMDTETAYFSECGADAILTKPVKIDTLRQLLRICAEFGTRSPRASAEPRSQSSKLLADALAQLEKSQLQLH